MGLSTDIRGIWTGLAVNIPSGWSRDTAFDTRYLQGGNVKFSGPVNGGGSHNHTCDAHDHQGNSHSHSISGGTSSGASRIRASTSGTPTATTAVLYTPSHTHASVTSNGATQAYGSTVVTLDAATADPPFVKAIIISPNDGLQEYPQDATAFTDDTTAPGDFEIANGSLGTDDLGDLFIKGADASGNGGATGGSANHLHTQAGTGHTHTVGFGHSHTATNAGATSASSVTNAVGSGGTNVFPSVHHTVSLTTGTPGTPAHDDTSTSSASNEPDHVELTVIQNKGSAATPDGLILPFVGAVADIPAQWWLCDGTNGTPDLLSAQIKGITSGATGTRTGSNSHTHTITHGNSTHTHGSHSHTASAAVANGYSIASGSTNCIDSGPAPNHTHSWTVGSATPTVQDETVTMTSEDGRPSWRTVLWVKKDSTIATTVHVKGGTVLGNTVLK